MPIRPKDEDWSEEAREVLDLPEDIGEADTEDPPEEIPTTDPIPQDRPDIGDGA